MAQERGLREKLAKAVRREREGHLVASALTELARFLSDASRFAEAEALYDEAIAMRERLAGDPSAWLAHDCLHAAEAARAGRGEGAQAKARALWTRAMELGEKSRQPLVVIDAAKAIGEACAAAGQLDEAQDMFAKACATAEAYFGDDVRAFSRLVHRCAEIAVARGRDTLAAAHYARFIAMEMRTWGATAELARAMRELAAVYRRLDENESAQVLEEQLAKLGS